MTTLQTLSIRGIRSYPANVETIITFSQPLTIILGRNGSGKSTIIEAIKMATTGSLPPNVSHGSAFIHDPRIHNEHETKARIRLRFETGAGVYTVTRPFQLLIRRGKKPEYKALTAKLKRKDDGAESAYNPTKLNILLPERMRVSKPILENVIFVHQEDSLWPLSEARKLKERLDDIFAATRYTKALEVIRRYRRERATEIRTVNVQLMHYEEKVRDLERVRAELDAIKVKHDQLKKGADALTGQIDKLKEERESIRAVCNIYEGKTANLQKLTMERDVLQKDKADKYDDMQVHLPDVTPAILREGIEKLQSQLETSDQKRVEARRKVSDVRALLQMLREQLNKRQVRRGVLEHMQRDCNDRVERLTRMKRVLIQDTGEQWKVLTEKHGHLSVPALEQGNEQWLQWLSRMVDDAKENVQRIVKQTDATAQGAIDEVKDAQIRQAAISDEMDRTEKQRAEMRAELRDIRKKIAGLEDAQALVMESETRLKHAQQEVEQHGRTDNSEQLEADIKAAMKSVDENKDTLQGLRRTRRDLAHDQNEHARLEVARETTKRQYTSLVLLVEEFCDTVSQAVQTVDLGAEFKERLGGILPVTKENVKECMERSSALSDRVQSRADVLLRDAEDKVNEEQNKASIHRGRLSDVVKRREEMQTEFSKCTQAVSEAATQLGRLNINSEMERVRDELCASPRAITDVQITQCRDMLCTTQTETKKMGECVSHMDAFVIMATQELDEFEKDDRHRCPACRMSSTKKVDVMRQGLGARIERYKNPEERAEKRRHLENLERMGGVLGDLVKKAAVCKEMHAELEAVVKRAGGLEEVVGAVGKRLQTAHAEMKVLQGKVGEGSVVRSLYSKDVEVNQAYSGVQRGERQYEVLQRRVSHSGCTRTLGEIDGEIGTVEECMSGLQDAMDAKRRVVGLCHREARRLEGRLHEAKQQCLEQKNLAEEHVRMEERKRVVVAEVGVKDAGLEELLREEPVVATEVRRGESEVETIRAENGVLVRHCQGVESRRKAELERWTDVCAEIEGYEKGRRGEELMTVVESIEGIEKEVGEKSEVMQGVEESIQSALDRQYAMKGRLRNMRDNQKYRLKSQELEVKVRCMRDVEREIGEVCRGFGEELATEGLVRVGEEIMEKEKVRSATVGKQQGYTDGYKEKKKELEKCESEGSTRKYDECRINKQTMQLALEDLEVYHRALDQALVAYHTMKMTSINRTIKELWQRTYRGTDIEEIEIVSDCEGGGRRAYNYRVMMRQGRARLDMRGRCSAGQKVLACIVIRLALAECFCAECGMLGLDEPTTNLDRENVQSLALGLRAVIERGRGQRNFQLVLITHDQEFIEMVGGKQFCEEFITVYKEGGGGSQAFTRKIHELW